MSNVLKMPVQNRIQNLAAHGWSARRIARELGLNRRTVSRYLIAASKCTTPDSEVTTGSGHLPELADPVSGSKCTTPGNEVTTGSGHLPELADPVSDSKCTTPGNEVTTGSGHLPELADPVSGSKCTIPSNKVITGCGQEILPSSGPAPAVAVAAAVASASASAAVAVATTASRSKCGAFREVIVPLFEKGLTAQRIYQDLRVEHAFTGAYESVKRFLAGLRAAAPVPVHRVEAQPGEEMQVEFGLGAPVVGKDLRGA